jgi:hypothetical protein
VNEYEQISEKTYLKAAIAMDCKKSEAEITERAPGITKKCLWSKSSTYAIFYENSSENGVLKEKIDIFNAGYLLD